ncbi:MAG TPA: DUF1329 domain-containing protein [Burkholderiaceae bacterium]|nr:DUF1329 domain-containing protein [Burkholderiaceae bacterium]HMX11592.1 DUF1329 domain-containing protein [Burkholderiaceae bacterium]HMY98433.1 DUF1329 domain-containing protein [Burkholderiaceae bacterium]HNB43089.1 DUF1329 domain-containing protein [Burkholderiaceae bacterium]HNG78132.1 DUF1329 domain-containing protein [Burkholderiaceae bacterium]
MKTPMIPAPIALAVGLAMMGSAWAKVPAAEADKLGKELTCVGAEKAGTASGVPEFTGKWVGTPPGVDYKPHTGQHPVDVYASEKPLFTITSANLSQYADRLSDGQKAAFAKYPKTYRMPVYPGHRDFRYPDSVCAVVKKNALESEVTDGGLGIKGSKGGINFPIPKNGAELLWNNLLPYRAFNEHTVRDFASVLSDGKVTWGRANNKSLDLTNQPGERGKPLEGIMARSFNQALLPEREKGGVNVSAEPLNFAKGKRLAWSYDPGTRRVRQVPEYGFDQPLNGTGGTMTIDSDRLFNGSPERYDWKMVGKREMYIPANAYKVHQPTVKYADLLSVGHPNPDYLRYELRRVWVLEATLKEGFRHLYAKRVLFIDEDTGHAVATDIYDARGQLWQHAFINYYYAYDLSAWHAGSSFYMDLNGGRYVAYNLFQERPIGPVLNKGDLTPEMFTPEAARASGN